MWRSSWGMPCATLLFLVACVTPTQAQKPSADFQAVIGAPRSVELANTGAITLMVSLRRLNESNQNPLPAKIVLDTTEGRWLKDSATPSVSDEQTSTSPQEVEVNTTPGPCTATLVLATAPAQSPVRVDVYLVRTQPGDQPEKIGSKEITLHRPMSIKFGSVTDTVLADGKSTGAISLRLLDEAGQGIKNEPLFLQGYGPQDQGKAEIVVDATTDDTGRATFILPPSPRVGRSFVSVIGPGVFNDPISTWQLEVDYVGRTRQRPKPLLANPYWWKHPYLLGIGGK